MAQALAWLRPDIIRSQPRDTSEKSDLWLSFALALCVPLLIRPLLSAFSLCFSTWLGLNPEV